MKTLFVVCFASSLAGVLSVCPYFSSSPTIYSAGENDDDTITAISGIEYTVSLDLGWEGTESATSFEVKVENADGDFGNFVASETSLMGTVTLNGMEEDAKVKFTVKGTDGSCPSITTTLKLNAYYWWAPILPIGATLLSALLMRSLIIGLLVGCYAGRSMIEFESNFFKLVDTDIPSGLMSVAPVLIFVWLLTGILGAASRSGGVAGFTKNMVKLVQDSFLGQLVVWLAGVCLFYDEYGSIMIIGNSFWCITRRVKISPSKMAMIVDCTAGPIASLVPLSTQLGIQLILLQITLDSIGYDEYKPYELIIKSLPYQFYSIVMIAFVPLIILLGRDFGPMFYAENKARNSHNCESGEEDEEEEPPKKFGAYIEVEPKPGVEGRWWNAIVPFLLLAIIFLPLLYYSGIEEGDYDYDSNFQDIIGAADSVSVLIWSSVATLGFQIIMYGVQWKKKWGGCLLNPTEVIDAAIESMKNALKPTLIMILAVVLGNITTELMLGEFITSYLDDSLDPVYLPATVFSVCAAISFATGVSSMGTMAIMLPWAVYLTYSVVFDSGDNFTRALTHTIAAVISGSVMGDHCCPFSVSTVLSALACHCGVWKHFTTQMPYALLVGAVSVGAGYIPLGFDVPVYACIVCAIFASFILFWVLTLIPVIGGATLIYTDSVHCVTGRGTRGVVSSCKHCCCCQSDTGYPSDARMVSGDTEMNSVDLDKDDRPSPSAPPQNQDDESDRDYRGTSMDGYSDEHSEEEEDDL